MTVSSTPQAFHTNIAPRPTDPLAAFGPLVAPGPPGPRRPPKTGPTNCSRSIRRPPRSVRRSPGSGSTATCPTRCSPNCAARCSSGRCCSSATRTSTAPTTARSRPDGAIWNSTRSSSTPSPARATRTSPPSRRTRWRAAVENLWHNDVTWHEFPSFAAVLRAVEIPPVGGDTLWTDTAAAYDLLPEDIRARIDHLDAEHDWIQLVRPRHAAGGRGDAPTELPRGDAPGGAGHPGDRPARAVRQHRLHAAHSGCVGAGVQRTADDAVPARAASRVPGPAAVADQTRSRSGTTGPASTTRPATTTRPAGSWTASRSSATSRSASRPDQSLVVRAHPDDELAEVRAVRAFRGTRRARSPVRRRRPRGSSPALVRSTRRCRARSPRTSPDELALDEAADGEALTSTSPMKPGSRSGPSGTAAAL